MGGFGHNAVELLKADNRHIEGWFEEFQGTDDDGEKQTLAASICRALTVHAQLEEEYFHPAFMEAVENSPLHHEAVVRLDLARSLVATIEESNPDDEYFEARLQVLAQIFQFHVNEEERAGGMFDAAESSDIDLDALGEEMDGRRSELLADS